MPLWMPSGADGWRELPYSCPRTCRKGSRHMPAPFGTPSPERSSVPGTGRRPQALQSTTMGLSGPYRLTCTEISR